MTGIEVIRGDGPVVLGLPHTGTWVPDGIFRDLNDTGRALADTDWHIERLYDGLLDGVTTVRTPVHRYVIDVNRDPGGNSLYPGQNTTGLCPLTDFDGQSIWAEGRAPDAAETADRLARYHRPYHAALEAELARVRDRHGVAILYDCHSIRSRIPFLFEGVLPDLNIGTDGGRTAAPVLEAAVARIAAASPYTSVLNGRFRGGWTTRHYGRPDEGLHAIQMEIAQSAYLTAEAPPWTYDTAAADRLRACLREILGTLARLAKDLRK